MTEVDMELSEADGLELWPLKVSVGEITYPPGATLGPRRQDDLQLVLLHTGSMTIWIDGQVATIPAGTVTLLLPGHWERFAFARNARSRHGWMQAHVPALPPAMMERLRQVPRTLPLSTTLADLARDAAAVVGQPWIASQPLIKALTVAALWCYLAEAEAPRGRHPSAVAAACRFLNTHLDDKDLTLDSVARAGNVTPAHLTRRFRAELGATPMAYLWQRRVAVGVDLLTNTGLPIASIASRCGFKTVHHFSRRIKEATGQTPGQFRRSRWQSIGRHSL